MKLEKLKLTNFRSHVSTEFDLSRVNVVRALNGGGKSSIQMAIEFLLTGKCDVTDAAGRGAQSLITAGKQELGVQASFLETLATLEERRAVMTRSRNQVGGNLIISNGATFAGKHSEAWLEANLGPTAVLSSVLNAHRFLEMEPKEQKALLAGALAAEPVEIEKEILELHKTITAGFPLQTSIATADEADRLHKWHYDLRTNVNREIKALGEITEPEISDQMPTREEVTSQITALEADRTKLIQQRSQTIGAYHGRKDQLEAAKQQKMLFERDLLSSEQIADLEKQVKNRTKVAKLDKEIADFQTSLRTAKTAIASFRNPQADTCPTCGQKVETMDYTVAIQGAEKEIEALQASLTAKVAERNRIPDPELAKQKLDTHARAQSPYLRAEQTIKDIGELGDAPDVSAEDAEIAALTERIQKGREIERNVAELEGKQKQYEQVSKKAATLKAQSVALDRLVEYFSDKGPLKGKLVGGRLPAFRDRINQVLFRFGFYCELELDPYQIFVTSAASPNRPKLALPQLSQSEKYRFGIAFQVSLAEATGVGLVVIDEADMLQDDARRNLTIELMESKLDQAFVLSTGEPMDEFPDIPGVAFFELENVGGETTIRAQHKSELKETVYANE